MDKVQRVNVLGVGISAIDPPTALDYMVHWIESQQRHYVCVCAVHTVMECQEDPELRAMVNGASLCVPDGMPLVWIARLTGQRHVGRVYGPDLMLSFCELAAQRGYRNYLLGGIEGRPEALAQQLTIRFPDLSVVGMRPTPERPLPPAENEDVIAEINRVAPDVVWVGIGTPFQDRWIAQNRDRLAAPILVAVGAAFDINSGVVRQAPHWMQRTGLEWLFRFLQEPRRLWRRYLLGNPLFVAKLISQRLGLRQYDLPSKDPTPPPACVPESPSLVSSDLAIAEPEPRMQR
jgi:N-acetylglucosaminyldiphosphoundecaprenol N-acetyl-beta-D-mannosaminyltransferase